MARPRTIDRDRVLDAAESALAEGGAAALSFSGVAAGAGLSKASVQSAFGSRAALVDALIDRSLQRERERYRAALGDAASDATSDDARLEAHLSATRAEIAGESGRRTAILIAALASEGRRSDSVRRWYRERLGDLTADSAAERRRRAAYLAAEGAYFLRCMIGVDADEATWADIFDDLARGHGL